MLRKNTGLLVCSSVWRGFQLFSTHTHTHRCSWRQISFRKQFAEPVWDVLKWPAYWWVTSLVGWLSFIYSVSLISTSLLQEIPRNRLHTNSTTRPEQEHQRMSNNIVGFCWMRSTHADLDMFFMFGSAENSQHISLSLSRWKSTID